MKGDPVGQHVVAFDFPKGDGPISIRLIPVGKNGALEWGRARILTLREFDGLMSRRSRQITVPDPDAPDQPARIEQ